MESSSSFLGSEPYQPVVGGEARFSEGFASCRSTRFAPLLKILRTIPPERVGLQGEYDHSGLAKRVALAVSSQFESVEVGHLRITQRGAVVVVVGNIANSRLMARLVSAILSVRGAADVEINGMSMIRPLCISAIEPDCLEAVDRSYAF